MGIYDKINGSTEFQDPPGIEFGVEEDYELTVDLTNGATVSGDFDVDFGGDPPAPGPDTDPYEFTPVSGSGGTLSANITTGVWTFTSDGTAEIGDTFVFSVDTGFTSDTDTVTITFTCFAEGTRIATPGGETAIEMLAPGDMVTTRDAGAQPLRWIGSRRLDAPGAFGAIVIPAGTLGNDRELRVSPAHRILVTGWRAEALTGRAEVLVTARSLLGHDRIWQDRDSPVTYWHMLFDRHQIVTSEGVPSESYNPSATGLADLGDATRDEVLALFPELAVDPARYGPPARPAVDDALGAMLARTA